MEWILDSFTFVPELIRPQIVGIFIIIIGYTLSKVLAAIVMSTLPKESPTQEIDELNSSWQQRTGRSCFWFSWLVFILTALDQMYAGKFNLSFQSINYFQLSLMSLLAYILIITEDSFSKFAKAMFDLFQSIPLPKSNPTFRFLRRYIWVPILVIFITALASPETLGRKFTITVIIVFTGWLLSAVVKQALIATLGSSGKLQRFLPKFLCYFVLVHFLIAAIRLWRG